MTREYKHAEAFCIMEYRCETCGTVEKIWNSRDGVTPYTVPCRCGHGEMVHVNWNKDRRGVNHIVQSGERIFIDMPEDMKRVIALKKADLVLKRKLEKKRTFDELVEIFINDFNEGDPYVLIIN